MSELWRDLQVGDQIQIVRVPKEFSQRGYYIHADTLRVYERLITAGTVLTVDRIDESGLPWVEFSCENEDGQQEFHSLAVNHDGLERVVDPDGAS